MCLKFSQRGFGLLEVMITVGLLGLISLGVMKVTDNMTNQTRNFTARTEVTTLHNEMLGVLAKPENCLATMQSSTGTPFSAIQADVTVIRDVIPGGIANRFEINKNYPGNVKIKSMLLREDAPGSALSKRETRLFVTYEVGKAGVSKEVVHFIKIWFDPETPIDPTIKNCRSLAGENDNTWSREAGSMNNIVYSGGRVSVEALRTTGPIGTCDANNSGKTSFNSTTKLYEYCDGTKITELIPACANNEIYFKSTTLSGCINAAKAMCISVGFIDFDKNILKTCSNFRCASLTCYNTHYDSKEGCEGAVESANDGQIITISGYYRNKHSSRSDTHHWVQGTYKCDKSNWVHIGGGAHTPDNSYIGIQAANR